MCARRMKVPKIIIESNRLTAAPSPVSARSKRPASMSQQCASCKFWTGGTNCRAFPQGIPESILKGKQDHAKSYPGDRGFRYQPAD